MLLFFLALFIVPTTIANQMPLQVRARFIAMACACRFGPAPCANCPYMCDPAPLPSADRRQIRNSVATPVIGSDQRSLDLNPSSPCNQAKAAGLSMHVYVCSKLSRRPYLQMNRQGQAELIGSHGFPTEVAHRPG